MNNKLIHLWATTSLNHPGFSPQTSIQKHTKTNRKSIKVAAALEARLQTLEHLNSEEAATMLSRMAPQQASQMVPWSKIVFFRV